jgi:hypothetical protein
MELVGHPAFRESPGMSILRDARHIWNVIESIVNVQTSDQHLATVAAL